ncbi:unnamed protein product [Camellia sinensis]
MFTILLCKRESSVVGGQSSRDLIMSSSKYMAYSSLPSPIADLCSFSSTATTSTTVVEKFLAKGDLYVDKSEEMKVTSRTAVTPRCTCYLFWILHYCNILKIMLLGCVSLYFVFNGGEAFWSRCIFVLHFVVLKLCKDVCHSI